MITSNAFINQIRPGRVAIALAGGALLTLATGLPAADTQAASLQTRPAAPTEVSVEIRTSPDRLGGATDDQLTLIFSSVSAELQRTPPQPLFGADIMAEFSFSGRDARPGATLVFKRAVTDERFLTARFVRLINHGADSWGGESLSMSVNGRRVLDRQSLYPRKGTQPNGGIEKFNPLQWYERVYWEADLQKIRVDRYSAR
jgi:hypothetical protein